MLDQAQDGKQRQHGFKSWLEALLSCRILDISLTASVMIGEVGPVITTPSYFIRGWEACRSKHMRKRPQLKAIKHKVSL